MMVQSDQSFDKDIKTEIIDTSSKMILTKT